MYSLLSSTHSEVRFISVVQFSMLLGGVKAPAHATALSAVSRVHQALHWGRDTLHTRIFCYTSLKIMQVHITRPHTHLYSSQTSQCDFCKWLEQASACTISSIHDIKAYSFYHAAIMQTYPSFLIEIRSSLLFFSFQILTSPHAHPPLQTSQFKRPCHPQETQPSSSSTPTRISYIQMGSSMASWLRA